jgi:RNA-binding protein
MQSLTSSQAKFLRGLAHNLKPVVFIGQKGITTAVLQAIREALDVHELIKVRFADLPDKRLRMDVVSEVRQTTDSFLAGLIGHVAIFYRPQPDPAKRKIVFK